MGPQIEREEKEEEKDAAAEAGAASPRPESLERTERCVSGWKCKLTIRVSVEKGDLLFLLRRNKREFPQRPAAHHLSYSERGLSTLLTKAYT